MELQTNKKKISKTKTIEIVNCQMYQIENKYQKLNYRQQKKKPPPKKKPTKKKNVLRQKYQIENKYHKLNPKYKPVTQ